MLEELEKLFPIYPIAIMFLTLTRREPHAETFPVLKRTILTIILIEELKILFSNRQFNVQCFCFSMLAGVSSAVLT